MYCLRTDISIGLLDSYYIIPNIELAKNGKYFEIIFNIFFFYINICCSFEDIDSEDYQSN